MIGRRLSDLHSPPNNLNGLRFGFQEQEGMKYLRVMQVDTVLIQSITLYEIVLKILIFFHFVPHL